MEKYFLIVLLIVILLNHITIYENMTSKTTNKPHKPHKPHKDICIGYTSNNNQCSVCQDTKLIYSNKCITEQTFINCKQDITKVFDKVNECKMCLYCNFKNATNNLKTS